MNIDISFSLRNDYTNFMVIFYINHTRHRVVVRKLDFLIQRTTRNLLMHFL